VPLEAAAGDLLLDRIAGRARSGRNAVGFHALPRWPTPS